MQKSPHPELITDLGDIVREFPIRPFILVMNDLNFTGGLLVLFLIPIFIVWWFIETISFFSLWFILLYLFLLICCVFLIPIVKREYRIVKLRNGLKIFQKGVMLPVSDHEGSRPEPIYVLFKNIEAVLFISKKDYEHDIDNKKKIILKDQGYYFTQLNRYREYDLETNILPDDICLIDIYEDSGNGKRHNITSYHYLINGHDAMKCLMESILNTNNIQRKGINVV